MHEQQIVKWVASIKAEIADLERKLSKRGVPIIRGSLRDEGIAVVELESFDAAALALVVDGSLCVVDWHTPTLPLDEDESLEDLDVYIRLGLSNTWIHFGTEAPFDESAEEGDEGVRWPFAAPQTLTIDQASVKRLALQVAKAPGFASLRNRTERQDFASAVLSEDSPTVLSRYDLWEISKTAETLFTLGVAPSQAKALEREGKSLNEIAKALGVSKQRAERVLATAIPAHISKLL